MENTPRKLIVHHTGDLSSADQLDKINIDHKRRGFTQSELGFFVGYHFLIHRSGNITRTRNDNEQGCHDKGENTDSLGIALEGDFDIEVPTKEQVVALGALLAAKCEEWGLGVSDILPHRFRDNTSCYGKLLSDDWARIVCLEAQNRRLRDFLLQICTANTLKFS